MSDTPKTDAFEALLIRPVDWWDFARELERENAALRELTSTLGAPNHINIPVEKWRELWADKERLDWIIGKAHYLFFKELGSDHAKGRQQIDAARKEAQP